MKRKLRNWMKSIIFECLKEVVKQQPLIISNRIPRAQDTYSKGTLWMTDKETYECTGITATWKIHKLYP